MTKLLYLAYTAVHSNVSSNINNNTTSQLLLCNYYY